MSFVVQPDCRPVFFFFSPSFTSCWIFSLERAQGCTSWSQLRASWCAAAAVRLHLPVLTLRCTSKVQSNSLMGENRISAVIELTYTWTFHPCKGFTLIEDVSQGPQKKHSVFHCIICLGCEHTCFFHRLLSKIHSFISVFSWILPAVRSTFVMEIKGRVGGCRTGGSTWAERFPSRLQQVSWFIIMRCF